MAEICEICGNPIRGLINTIQVDEGVFRVCSVCAKLGKPVKMPKDPRPAPLLNLRPPPTQRSKPPRGEVQYDDPEMELQKDFHMVIRAAREKMGISQEEFGRKINEKLSVIKHLETGKLKPNNLLTRKLERSLKIKLLVPVEEED
jgi:putative transcription factor